MVRYLGLGGGADHDPSEDEQGDEQAVDRFGGLDEGFKGSEGYRA